MFKLLHSCTHLTLAAAAAAHANVMFKILQARLQQYVNCELPEIKLPTSAGNGKSKSSRKTSISNLLTISKPLTVWITINCGKF